MYAIRSYYDVHVVPRYLNDAVKETGVPNVVTAVLASYRGYDTLGETTVVFTAGAGVIALLRRRRRAAKGANVITSYSIHYTKLYEGRSPRDVASSATATRARNVS